MTRAELLARIGRQLNKSDTLDPRTKQRLLDSLNSRHRSILSAPGCQALRRREERFTSMAGQARYGISNAEAIKHMRDLTNDVELSQRSLGVYRQYNPDPTTTQGTSNAFVPIGFEPVAIQPGGLGIGTPLFVKSNNTADTQTVYIEGNYPPGFTGPLTGTTAVALGNWQRVDKFYLSAVPAGVVTLHMDSATGTEIARLHNQLAGHYLAFYLDPTPAAAITYELDCEFRITDLAQDTDEPWIPSDFHDVLELGAIMDECFHLDDTRALVWQRRYEQRLGELQLRLARQGTDTGPHGRPSRYGSWGPSTSW